MKGCEHGVAALYTHMHGVFCLEEGGHDHLSHKLMSSSSQLSGMPSEDF